MKLRVIIVDGVVDDVLSDDEAFQAGLEVTIVDLDHEDSNMKASDFSSEAGLQSILFDFIHPMDAQHSNNNVEQEE